MDAESTRGDLQAGPPSGYLCAPSATSTVRLKLSLRLVCAAQPCPRHQGLNTTLKTRSAKKGSIQKSKHVSFNCQDYSRARVYFQSLLGFTRGPAGTSFQFSSNLALALSAPDLAGRVQAANHCHIQGLSNIGGWHQRKRFCSPGTESKCVFNHAKASDSFQCDLPPATSSGGSEATRPRGCAPAAGRAGRVTRPRGRSGA